MSNQSIKYGILLTKEQLAQCHPDCVKIDLASKTGMEGDSVIVARACRASTCRKVPAV